MPLFDQLRHEAVEEGQQKRRDMGSVDIGIGHDDNPVIAKLCDIKILMDSAAKCCNHRLDLGIAQDTVQPCLLDVEDLSSERKDGLRRTRTRCLCGASCRISLNQKDLTVLRILVRAVRKLTWERHPVECRLSPRQVPRLPGRVPGSLRHHRLLDNELSDLRMLLQIDGKLL